VCNVSMRCFYAIRISVLTELAMSNRVSVAECSFARPPRRARGSPSRITGDSVTCGPTPRHRGLGS